MAVTVRLLSSMSPSGTAVVEAPDHAGRIDRGARDSPFGGGVLVPPDRERWRRDVNVFVNQTHVREIGGMAAAIEDGAEVLALPASAVG